jgi:hypothetical protein
MEYAEQKVKVPSLHCDARVQTVSADVMNLSKDKVRALSPQVLQYGYLLRYSNLTYFMVLTIFHYSLTQLVLVMAWN